MFKTTAIAAVFAVFTIAANAADAPAAPMHGVLATPSGATVYTFDKDMAGNGKSTCNGPCAQAWPPVAAQASDIAGGDWNIITRDDGSKQWAYKGSPLYTYSKDARAGDKMGDNFKEVWHVIKG
jgi:predicted lipoprotein with Yx(FWY)xxD motif